MKNIFFRKYNSRISVCRTLFGNFFSLKEKKTNEYYRMSIKFFGKSVFEKRISYGTINYKFFNIFSKKINIKTYFRNFITKLNNDDIYYMFSNGGECFLFFAYCAKIFIKKNCSKKPLFIATQKFQADILKMYIPEAKVLYLPDLYFLGEEKNVIKIKNHNVFLIFSHGHFIPLERDIENSEAGSVHFFDRILETLKMEKSECSKPELNILPKYEKSLKIKLKKIDLNVKNFVIIAPETKSSSPLKISLWKKIIKEFKSRNIDVFLNVKDEEFIFDECKYTKLNYHEAFLLAQKANALICVKSGFPEVLLPAKCPTIAVYTEFRNRKKYHIPVKNIIEAFSMHKLPFVNHDLICELNYDNFQNDDKLFETIMLNYDKMRINR